MNKDNLKVDFAEIFDAAEMDDIYNVAERRRHSLGANDVRLGSRVMVEFTIAIWRKKPERSGCTYISLDQRGAIGACEGQCFGGVPVAKEETEDGQMKGGKKGRRQEKSKCIVVSELKCTVFPRSEHVKMR